MQLENSRRVIRDSSLVLGLDPLSPVIDVKPAEIEVLDEIESLQRGGREYQAKCRGRQNFVSPALLLDTLGEQGVRW